MTRVGAKVVWTAPPSRMAAMVADYRRRLILAVKELMDWFAGRAQSEAQANAPWTDRTANARQGLTGRAFQQAAKVLLILGHTMSYGIWLEVRWGGKWGIVLKTLNALYPQIMAALRQLAR